MTETTNRETTEVRRASLLQYIKDGGFPLLTEAATAENGNDLLEELDRLLGFRWRPRSERRQVHVIAHLQSGECDEPVLVRDISETGVRLRLDPDCLLEPHTQKHPRLLLRVIRGQQSRAVALGMVYVRAVDLERHEHAFHFQDLEESKELLAGGLRNLIFLLDNARHEA